MAIKTVKVERGAVVSLNSEASIAVGSIMEVTNTSETLQAYLKESATEPTNAPIDARLVTRSGRVGCNVYIPAGSGEIWAFSEAGPLELTVEAL